MRYLKSLTVGFWTTPVTKSETLVWSIAAALPTALLWEWLNSATYALFFPAIAIIAARSKCASRLTESSSELGDPVREISRK